ncbi:MAG: ABC transporter ATP-binding protein [Lachnospiraceae bacterium]|nr:ABC transporter ATP-binding protein [Lachnospiraceae bacterium]
MNEPPAPVLSVRDLNIEFHDHLIPETVVYDFNLELYPGEIVGIVGESGSGKSMCALAVAGLLRRQDMKKSGEIIFDGYNLLNCPRSILRKYQGKDISIVFQEPMTALNPVKRIGWQIEETLRIHTTLSRAECYEKVVKMLRDVELPDPERVCRQYPHELSGGMRQRVMIAMAMICEPKILIADEITTALDVIIQSQIIELLKRLNRERKTAILFISHDLSLVKQLCGRVIVLKGGYIV